VLDDFLILILEVMEGSSLNHNSLFFGVQPQHGVLEDLLILMLEVLEGF